MCDLISGRERHTAQKEWYAERERQAYTQRQRCTQRDRQTDTYMHAEREERRETEGKRILDILTLPVVHSMWMGTEPLKH